MKTTATMTYPGLHRDDCTRPVLRVWTGRLGDDMISCRTCQAIARVDEVQPSPSTTVSGDTEVSPAASTSTSRAEPTPPPIVARFWLGPCLGCTTELWVLSRRPRVPICATCRPGGVPVLASP